MLDAAKLSGNEEIETKSAGRKRLADALREDFDITALSRNVLTKLAEATDSAPLRNLLGDGAKEQLREFITGREIIDAIVEFAPAGLPADALAGIVPQAAAAPLFDRLQPAGAHRRGAPHGGRRALFPMAAAQGRLLDLSGGSRETRRPVPVFVQPNKNFRLPADGSTPIIMVGPAPASRRSAPSSSTAPRSEPAGKTGCSWATSTTSTISSISSNGRTTSRRRAQPSSTSRSRATSRRRSTSSTA
jgi:sulfite reductase (NADPH) flavoprotein alpha-component